MQVSIVYTFVFYESLFFLRKTKLASNKYNVTAEYNVTVLAKEYDMCMGYRQIYNVDISSLTQKHANTHMHTFRDRLLGHHISYRNCFHILYLLQKLQVKSI